MGVIDIILGIFSWPTWLLVIVGFFVFIVTLKLLWGTMKAFVRFVVFIAILGLIIWLGFRFFVG